jgi:hypothetical protein
MKEKKQEKPLNKFARFSGIGFQMIAIIAFGTFVGVKLDEKYPNEKNLFTLSFSLGSVIISILYVIRQIISASKDN